MSLRTVRSAYQMSGNWTEPEPLYTPRQEDEIADLAAELYAEQTEGDDWFLSMAERGALMRECKRKAVEAYEMRRDA